MAAIELEHVTKEFAGGVVAVDDVNLTITDGEFMVLVGPSGCGKSTLLRMIAGLDSYTAAKGGVTSMVRSFAAGVGRDGVRVNAIAPSFVSTEPQMVWLDDDQARATIASLHILPIPTPEQIAPFVVYLASDESATVTGGVFPIDAGYMAFKAQVDVMGTVQAGY